MKTPINKPPEGSYPLWDPSGHRHGTVYRHFDNTWVYYPSIIKEYVAELPKPIPLPQFHGQEELSAEDILFIQDLDNLPPTVVT